MNKWLELVAKLAPMVLMTVPGGEVLAPLAPVIIHAIQEAQQFKGASGADKKAHVINVVADAIQTTNTIAGKAVLEPTAVLVTAGLAVDTVVGVVNVVDKAHAVAVASAPPAHSPVAG